MKRLIILIPMLLMIIGTKATVWAAGNTASSSICVKIIFPQSTQRNKLNKVTLKEFKGQSYKKYKNKIKNGNLYVISRNGDELTYKIKGKINYKGMIDIVNSVKRSLSSGDYIAICNINGSPTSYRFKIPS